MVSWVSTNKKTCRVALVLACVIFWTLYILRWAVFIGFNVYERYWYPFYFYLIELLRFAFWINALVYIVKPRWYDNACGQVILAITTIFAFLNFVFRVFTDYVIFK